MKLLSLIVFVFFISLPMLAQNEEDLSGRKAPNFKLIDLNGKYLELNKTTGSGPILLSFWATWCKPCLEEMTEYNKIYNQYKEKGFTEEEIISFKNFLIRVIDNFRDVI